MILAVEQMGHASVPDHILRNRRNGWRGFIMSTPSQNNEPGVEQTTWKQPAGNVPTDALKATQAHVDNLEGETVLVEQSTVDHIKGDRVTIKMSKASSVEASSVQMEKSAAVTVGSEKSVLQESAAAHVDAAHLRMVKSSALLVQSSDTTMEEGSTAFLVITGGLSGEARALVTVPAAAIVGALFAILSTVLFAIIKGSRK
jgi:hypothetical protein